MPASVAQQVQRRREESARKTRQIKLDRTKAILRESTSDLAKSTALERLDAEGVEKDVELTELVELLPSVVSGVQSPANGTDFLVSKSKKEAKRAAKAAFNRDTEPGGTVGSSDLAGADEGASMQTLVCDERTAKSLPEYQRVFLEKAKAALKDPNVSEHVKSMMKDQAEQLLHQVNNGGSVEPDFNALEQIGKLGTIQKSAASPAYLAEQLDAAFMTATLAQKQQLSLLLPQIEELDERVTKTVDNKVRVAKSEPIRYDADNARTAQRIEAAIRDINANPLPSGDSAHAALGIPGPKEQVASLGAGPDSLGAPSADGNRGDLTGEQGKREPEPSANVTRQHANEGAAGELAKAEKELDEADSTIARQRAGELCTYWRLMKMHGG